MRYPQPQNSLRVLIVDDEPALGRAVSIALCRAGYEAENVLSGETALGVIRARQIDVLVLDLRIPDMPGDVIFEMAAALQPGLRHQTVFMTGDITQTAHQSIANCGCQFVQKPFELDVLLAAVAAVAPDAHDRDDLDGLPAARDASA